ncbi:FkbM family methyltransferase [Dyadobacter sp. CY261]|uniref:FkbM family methyltransferase n=1 Tax=Dyadobacter sp. CY261 TaxID=2907203 RepID=UPI001F226126|nr:FkbM family methyltransferase [Dyadobacter sp. CY261]MCF0071397.1 FkbM family methyltransferase [Dyadobacter sp. CY261]
MKNLVRSLAKKWFLEGKGNAIIKQTPEEKILALIARLRPYNPGIDLIRVGPNGDGGYLVPDDLEDIGACFSPGVYTVSEFEMECFRRGMRLFLADKSVDKPILSLDDSSYHFLKKHVGCTNTDDLITLDTWFNDFYGKKDKDILLQMDIEGSEYLTLTAASNDLLERCRIIVVEFHDLHKLWNPEFFRLANEVFGKILQTHTCVHIHPNNCIGLYKRLNIEIPPIAEFTFLRNDRFVKKSRQTEFPHPLDFDNMKREHIALPKQWYAG